MRVLETLYHLFFPSLLGVFRQELAAKHGLVVSETKMYTDYIPSYIELMDAIVRDTYEKTRGECDGRVLCLMIKSVCNSFCLQFVLFVRTHAFYVVSNALVVML